MFEVIDFIGIIAFAISGILVGIRHNLDLLGLFIASFLTALGGGIMRDIIVDKTPYSFTHNTPAIIVLIAIIAIITLRPYKKKNIENSKIFILSDSLGLSSFSISGALLAIESNFNITGILTVSFISAVGGGIVRDIIINEVPLIFKTGFYGTISLLIGLIIYCLDIFDFINIYTLFLTLLLGTSIRVIAYYKAWNLPKI